MANNVSSKVPTPGHVVYDSRNDTSTGKKRAVIPGGKVSVAERARLFGGQVALSSSKTQPAKRPATIQPTKRPEVIQPTKRPEVIQPSKSKVVHQDRNYQPLNKNVDRRSNDDSAYSTSQRVSHHHHHRSPVQDDTRTKREQPSSKVKRQIPHSNNHNRHSSTRYQPSSSYDSFQHAYPQRANYTQIIPSESYTYDNNPYLEPPPSSRNTAYQTSNYFQPIRDPLEVLLNNSSQTYYQQQIPIITNNGIAGLQPFDLGNLISSIQEDYRNNVQPYVSSVQFIENNSEYDHSLTDIGFIASAATQKGYTRRIDDIYRRHDPSRHYNFIDTNGYHQYEKKQSFTDNRYSSMHRRRHRTRYHNQASSPIHIFEPSNKINTQRQSDNPPAAPIAKPPTPPTISSSEEEEEEEEEETTISEKAVSKPAQQATSSGHSTTVSESTTASEDESPEKPSTTTEQSSLPKPVIDATNAPQPSEVARPALPNQALARTPQTQARKVESEESETEESESDSDSESESEDEEPKPTAAPRSNNPQGTSGTPITRSANTPQINARVTPRVTTEDNSAKQPSERSNSIQSADPEETRKSSSFGSRLKSLTNKFRRK